MKPQIQIGVPTSGVREDVNQLVQTSDMAAVGENCIYFDGTIRPRPALDVQVENDTSIGNWQSILDGSAQEVIIGGDSIGGPQAIAQANDGSFIIISGSSVLWASKDNGQTWDDYGMAGPSADLSISQLAVSDEFLFAIGYDSTLGELQAWRTPIADMPEDEDWEIIASEAVTTRYLSDFPPVKYDADTDALIYVGKSSEGAGATTLYHKPYLWVIYTASEASPTSSLLGIDEPINEDASDKYYYRVTENFFGLGLDPSAYLMYGVYKVTALSSNWSGAMIHADSLEFDGSEYTLTRNEPVEIWRSEDGTTTNNPMNLNWPEFATTSEKVYAPVHPRPGIVSFFLTLGNNAFSDDHGYVIGEVDVASGGLSVRKTVTGLALPAPPVVAIQTAEKIVYGYRKGTTLELPDLIVSSNHGVDFLEINTESTTTGFYGGVEFSYGNDVTDQHFFVMQESVLGVRYPLSWLLPTSLGPSSLGSVTTVYQTDMDDENGALFIGTTNAVARLDASTGQWYRITANQLECDPQTGTPPSDWTDTGNIPPLSAGPGTDEYVSGVSIEGVYGQTPWIFRTFQMNGKVYVIGVNGQCYPIIYNEDMAGTPYAFARRLGEVPEGDDNYVEGDPAKTPTGDLAPRARCLAVAYDRVLLGNNPTGSSSEVNVSANLDADRGYDGPGGQLIALGDTPGGIVSMNEISALQVAIYKEDAIYHAVAQGDILGVSAPFRFELSKIGVSGPVSALSVQQNFDGRHIYLARDGGVYMYDGVAPLDGGRNIRRMIQKNIDLSKLGRCWGMVDTTRKLVWFFYPVAGGQVNAGIVISTDQGFPWPAWPVTLPRGWNFSCGRDIFLNNDITIGQVGAMDDYGDDVTLSSFESGQKAILVGRETGVFYTQKWDDNGDYSDSGLPINVHLRTGWTTPGQVEIYSADDLYHIFSSPDPEQKLEVRLRAQQVGQNIITRGPRDLWAGKPRRRTRHRLSGVQFAVDIKGAVSRMFNWGGALMTITKGGARG